ncbi:hypothetical protein KP509_35G047200 [Ceratopteris richardii]|uniref:BHLH domain-containing protein n=1 Tax=Ceratopteris richardii TaxID=49495 RepID=A0A8T2QGC5_CERRI|nr:hypothetical protein KP509_35G047200 [Ceratopteris richardii]KAH7282779.1 hypothetical protein KP509_35G047200 [Ceratopteris richardii]
MSSLLQQTLRGLCFDTGWCYAVFWKLKRQARQVLTWEDAFYLQSKADGMNSSGQASTRQCFGQQTSGLADMEDPIALAVSKMSYHVYSIGEGIIGRVAFTNKHQWVFSSNIKGSATGGASNKKANIHMQSKYPSGWDQQFAAGIKTIAIIAVPQGVVQFGSTTVIAEDLKLVGRAKSLFGTLQNVPGTFLSDLVSEGQKCEVHSGYPIAMSPFQMTLTAPLFPSSILGRTPLLSQTLERNSSMPTKVSSPAAPVGSVQGLLASQPQVALYGHSIISPSMPGVSENIQLLQHSSHEKAVSEVLSNQSFSGLEPSPSQRISDYTKRVEIVAMPGVRGGESMQIPVTSGMNLNSSPPTGIIKHLKFKAKASSMVPTAMGSLFPQYVHSSHSMSLSTATSNSNNTEAEQSKTTVDNKEPINLRAKLPSRTGLISKLSLSCNVSSAVVTPTINPLLSSDVKSHYYTQSTGSRDPKQLGVSILHQPNIHRNLSPNFEVSCVSQTSAADIPLSQGVEPLMYVCPEAIRNKTVSMPDIKSSEALKGVQNDSLVKTKRSELADLWHGGKSSTNSTEFCFAEAGDCSNAIDKIMPGSLQNMRFETSSGQPSLVNSHLYTRESQERPAERNAWLDKDRVSYKASELYASSSSIESGKSSYRLKSDSLQESVSSHDVDFVQMALNQPEHGAQPCTPVPFHGISSLTDRPPYYEKHQILSTTSGQHCINGQPVAKCILETSQADGNEFTIYSSMNREETSAYAMEQDLHGRKSNEVEIVAALSRQETSGANSRLKVQIPDLSDLAQRFQNVKSHESREVSPDFVDSYQSLSCSLLCDDYFESMQSLNALFRSPQYPSEDFGSADYSIQNLLANELDGFEEYLNFLNNVENDKNNNPHESERVCKIRNYEDMLTYLDPNSCGITGEREQKYSSIHSNENLPCHQRVFTESDCEPNLGCLIPSQSIGFQDINENSSRGKEIVNIEERFVNSRFYPEVSLRVSRPDGDKDLGCQALTALPNPNQMHYKSRKKGKKRSLTVEEDAIQRSKCRQKVQKQIKELRSLLPDGASCSIDTLLEGALDCVKALCTVLQRSRKESNTTILQVHDGFTKLKSDFKGTKSFNASWVMDLNQRVCPIVVESFSEPGQVLVEMLCQKHTFFSKITETLKELGFNILNGVLETRSDNTWARFVITGPKDIQRVQIMWELMQLLASSMNH